MSSGIVITAPASGSGKTVITLGLLRAIKNAGIGVSSIKIGPDYIDPTYHAAASGRSCQNLDLWGMTAETLYYQKMRAMHNSNVVVAEGVMGLFDGAATGLQSQKTGSTASAAKWLGWPIILVVDAMGQGASVAALVEGFANHCKDVKIAGVIFNKIGSQNHERILREALSVTKIPCIGCIPTHDCLHLQHRHLGLIQAREIAKLEVWLDEVAAILANSLDLDMLLNFAKSSTNSASLRHSSDCLPIPILGQHTAVAHDDAFAFCYDYVLDAWKSHGVEVTLFSPLSGETIHSCADSVYLPGGYPELYGSTIASNQEFKRTMKIAALNGAVIYGECGGFMVLGESLIDKDGESHEMLNLLPIKTSFVKPRLHMGYRKLSLVGSGALGRVGAEFKGHEFHYCEIIDEGRSDSLFHAQNARGEKLQSLGSKVGSVMGSFSHIIDRV